MSAGSSARAGELPPPIRVWLRSMSERTRALLEFHFDRDLQRQFEVAASGEEADVIIVDHDYPGCRADFEGGKWRDGPPLIVLAHGAVALDDALVLSKPLERSSLDAAAVRLREAPAGTRPAGLVGSAANDMQSPVAEAVARPVDASDTGSSPVAAPSNEPPLLEVTPVRPRSLPDRSAVASTPRDDRSLARVTALCGPGRSLAELAEGDDPAHRYDPARHLSGRLERALARLRTPDEEALGLRVSLPEIELYVLPWLDRICTSEPLTWQIGVERAFGRLEESDGEVVSYHAGSINELVDHVNVKACQAYPIDAFRWLAALFSARGRLPWSLSVEQPLRLARWPNLSRLEMTPECMRIVAEWTAADRSIAGMIDRIGCEPRFVTALHAATTAAGLLYPADSTDPGDPDEA